MAPMDFRTRANMDSREVEVRINARNSIARNGMYEMCHNVKNIYLGVGNSYVDKIIIKQ